MFIHVRKETPGLEVGSGGTRQSVGIHGGGICIDTDIDHNYADGRKRWEDGLQDDERESAIERERAVQWYYTSVLLYADEDDKRESQEQFMDALRMLGQYGWEVVKTDATSNPILTGGAPVLWAELRKRKTRAEQIL